MPRLIRLVAGTTLAAVVTSWCSWASADDLRIGVVAPLTGPSARLGAQVKVGAEAAAAETDPAAALELVDDQCTSDGGAAAAKKLAEDKVAIVVGFLCTESIEAAMPILKQAGIPVITVGVRTNSLTDRKNKTGWPVFRLAPRADAEGAAVSSILIDLWRSELFAIIDDGTIYGRDLAETLRSESEKAGLKPVFIDTYRPQLDNQIGLAGRLRKAGATHVFVGGDLDDIAILGRDAAKLGYDLTIAAGESLRSAASDVPLQPGTLMVGLPEWSDIASPEAVAAIKARGAEADGYALPTYAAVEIAKAANVQASGRPLLDSLAKGDFITAIGKIGFDDKGDLRDSPYRLFRFDGKKFVEAATQ
ncbi:ABC transporter substrate-binding protein [Mesorhizobium sp. BAC0120]|uniref:branched-chain amino acid ABC transporter substrate-binding protein n=1 Tax=Mesorhizobium sp. BAC0120 TaxID=3090670 RepID=UPI00298D08D5|nr:ABC transporter substrate-binding protein [Mesorhizobium sp. BAC0120]MDW6022686.1 ABC transporter substrate-binding protein [Mesorhizobium sp. BAC0120]